MTRRLSRVCVLRQAEVEFLVEDGRLLAPTPKNRNPYGWERMDYGRNEQIREAWERLCGRYARCFGCEWTGEVTFLEDEPTECPCCGQCRLATKAPPDGIYFARGPGIVRCDLWCVNGWNNPKPGDIDKTPCSCNPSGLERSELVPEDHETLDDDLLYGMKLLMTEGAKNTFLKNVMNAWDGASALRLIFVDENGEERRKDVMRECAG